MPMQLLLLERQGLTCGDTQLPFNKIKPRDGLGHRMLHLQARVHLHKIESHAASALLNNELHCAGADVMHRARSRHRRIAHLLPHGIGHAGCGRFFQHFLMPALNRAITLEQMHVVSMRVAKDLNLNVTRTLRVFLNQHRIVTKTVDGFALARGQCSGKVFGFIDRAHTFAAAAGTGFDEHRVTDSIGFALQKLRVLITPMVAGHQRHAGFFHEPLGLGFQAHGLDGRRWRAYENQTRISTGLRKLFVFAQKSIARMNRVSALGLSCSDDALPTQITVFRRAAADVYGFIAGRHMLGVRICV